ncbi:MAG: homoserine dehydrogenase [Oscillospiraceae bacterium]|jgi:homoserine dehydrogenase|nr:homoserine dehydrogenase [Oscillospiraceae bacterium]
MKRVTIGFLGCGNVGSGVWNLLEDIAPQIAHREGLAFTVKKALVRDAGKARGAQVPLDVLTQDPAQVLDDPGIDVVMEFMGGEQPATDYLLRALANGKSVVTANKMALAANWHLLQAQAQAHGRGLYYEAGVCGAVPIIRVLADSLQANRVNKLLGIINGTTNYILTRMAQEGKNYEDVLYDAQRLGLAEPDPTADVEGFDAAYKLSILSSLAFHAHVPVTRIYREGITNITAQDVAYGQQMHLTLKLLAVAKRDGQLVQVRVHPAFVPDDHPLAAVSGAFNAVFLQGHACGDMMLYGKGAGDMPTASAMVSDLVQAARATPHRHPTFANQAQAPADLNFDCDWASVYFIRLCAVDRPGALAAIAGCFADRGVSIASMMQKSTVVDGRVSLVFVTHQAHEQSVMRALRELDPAVAALGSVIRVEGLES